MTTHVNWSVIWRFHHKPELFVSSFILEAKCFAGQDNLMGSGTTALVCLLRNNTDLYVGHVGDSKALMCRCWTHFADVQSTPIDNEGPVQCFSKQSVVSSIEM